MRGTRNAKLKPWLMSGWWISSPPPPPTLKALELNILDLSYMGSGFGLGNEAEGLGNLKSLGGLRFGM